MTDGSRTIAAEALLSGDATLEYRQGDDEPLVDAVLAAVCDATGRDATDLPPLYSAVDPDALESLIESGGEAAVAFEYGAHHVLVDGGRTVTVY
ncbi:HalOD1 output domain-containing protein [Halomicrobium urmianum]|uniref:HalOD1 output domain-containing protein n=1 Tax=Halomicrobium urmianum TaxID=1586233 RepID=UPI001CD93683|nr:HalOD1 output domain-containing protein [Halomicrobium urmianum]